VAYQQNDIRQPSNMAAAKKKKKKIVACRYCRAVSTARKMPYAQRSGGVVANGSVKHLSWRQHGSSISISMKKR